MASVQKGKKVAESFNPLSIGRSGARTLQTDDRRNCDSKDPNVQHSDVRVKTSRNLFYCVSTQTPLEEFFQ